MVTEAAEVSDVDDTAEQAPNTWLNALLGAAVSVFLGFVPFSPVLGGALAGYLEGGDRGSGVRVGALSGLFAAIPFVLGALAIVAIVLIGDVGLSIFLLALVVLVLVGLYTVALGALGGILGVYIAEEV